VSIIARSRRAPAGAQYRLGLMSASLTGVTGLANAGTLSSAVYSFLWSNLSTTVTAATSGSGVTTYPMVCMVTQVEVIWSVNTTFTTAQDVSFGLYRVNSYTAAPTGGLAATFTATQTLTTGKFDSNYPITNFSKAGDIRISTAAALSAGTGNCDLYPMRQFMGNTNTIGVGPSTFKEFAMGNDPNTQALFFRNNEGFIIAPLVTMGAGGILDFYVSVEWIEMSSVLE